MKKIRLLLTLLAVSIGALQGAWADRTAPTLPEAQTLESGQSYYLYNVIEGKFLCRSTTSTSYPAIGTYGDKVVITATDNQDDYTIQWASNNYYFYALDSYVDSHNYDSSDGKFTISQSSQGYTIQRSPTNTSYYKSDEFIGYNGNNGDRLNPALAEGSIHWVLYSVDDAEYYMAKHKLYTYLEAADSYNFYVTQYDIVYNNVASTTAELNQAQETLANALEISRNYVSPSWTDYPILFQNGSNNRWVAYNRNTGLRWYLTSKGVDETSTLTATVDVDEDVTLIFKCETSNPYSNFRIYLDDELVQTISNNLCHNNVRRYYVEMGAGKHNIKWVCQFLGSSANNNSNYYSNITEIGVQKTPTMTPATTTVEGQLGTEVLKLTDNVANVKKIVVKGIIGADDWTTLGLMVNATSIDLSGATATGIPASMFTGSKFPFLHSFKMPQGLTSIGDGAFNYSDIEDEITFPSSLTTIGSSAFSNSKVKAAYMPDGITSIGNYAFHECYFLENAYWPSTVATIPYQCFYHCYNLRTFTIPEGVTNVDGYAFRDCLQFNARFPQSLEAIKHDAFYNSGIDRIVINENVSVESCAFGNCSNLVYVEFPTSFSNYIGWDSPIADCTKLKDVYFKSPTVVSYSSDWFLEGCTADGLTIHVPSYLVSAYKLDPYWYNYSIEGFSTANIEEWNVTKALTLNADQRIDGTPSLKVTSDGSLTINGSEAQTIKNLDIDYTPKSYSYYINGYGYYTIEQQWGMMLGNSDNTTITGRLTEQLRTAEKTWYFLCLPFDTKVGDITATADYTGAATSFAVRYYDGATRATGTTSGNWKNYTADDIIPAGTGFIYQTAKAARSIFVAQDNDTKQYILSNKQFVKDLTDYSSDATANKGWNLVGNPWQTYYNIHKLNFAAPITVWDMSNNKYEAYSIIDDDYAIKPLEAIFVQCPDEVNSISFPIDGRQLTDEIESQNAARALQPAERKLIDVELSNGELSDKTRFVLNPAAAMGYELSRDASKFFSMDAGVPQIYTIEQGQQLAINERPLGEGTVQLGIKVAAEGTYTITAPRNQFQNIVLVDNETGMETLLADGESYTFTASAGTNESRFVLRVGGTEVTGVDGVAMQSQQTGQAYNLQGQRVSQPQKGLYIVNGKKVMK